MLAIHTKSGPFAAGWVKYCQKNAVPFKEVDCFSSNIIEQLQGCRALMWYWEYHDRRAALFARQLIASVEQMGLIVFPSSSTCWHYDDKVGQKYLLEATGAPLVSTHVFFEEEAAMDWLTRASFPLVWKLRGGAGSRNVGLVQTLNKARRMVRRSFSKGWRPSRAHELQERIWQFRRDPSVGNFFKIGRGVARSIIPHKRYRDQIVDKNYVYFQDFVEDNDHDIRVVVIGERAFAIKRMVRAGDFRASGSGVIIHDPSEIPRDCLRISFDVTRAIASQCCALDFVFSEKGWRLVEISYAFSLAGYADCPGHWDPKLQWHPGAFCPESFVLEDVLSRLSSISPHCG